MINLNPRTKKVIKEAQDPKKALANYLLSAYSASKLAEEFAEMYLDNEKKAQPILISKQQLDKFFKVAEPKQRAKKE